MFKFDYGCSTTYVGCHQKEFRIGFVYIYDILQYINSLPNQLTFIYILFIFKI